MEDRFIRGSIAGFIAGSVMSIISFILTGLLKFGEDFLFDYAGEMLYGAAPSTPVEVPIAIFAHIVWTTFLGILFAYLTLIIGSSYILFKGWLFSLSLWFFLYAAGIMFEVPLLKYNTASTVASHLITATIFGLLLAVILQKLDNRIKT